MYKHTKKLFIILTLVFLLVGLGTLSATELNKNDTNTVKNTEITKTNTINKDTTSTSKVSTIQKDDDNTKLVDTKPNSKNKEKTPQIDRFRGKNSEKTAFGGHFLVSGQAVPRSRLYFFDRRFEFGDERGQVYMTDSRGVQRFLQK